MKSTTFTVLILALVGTIQCVNWANLTATELSQVPQDAFTTITAAELSSIPPQACTGFNLAQIYVMTAAAAPGLTSACLKDFPAGDSSPCGGFQAEFVAAMSPQAFAGWTSGCVAQLANMAFSQVTSAQWAAIDSAACIGFTLTVVPNFGASGASGMTAACLAQFSHNVDGTGGCSGFQPEFIGAMSPQAFAGWRAECTAALPTQAFSQVKSEQWAAIYSPACSGFNFYTVSQFNATSSSGMTADCLAQFSHKEDNTGGCSGLQAAFIGNMNPAAFAGWRPECTAKLVESTFSQVKSEQWAAINVSACGGFTFLAVSGFNVSSASGVPVGCVAALSHNSDTTGGCSGLKAPFVAQLTPQAFGGFLTPCVAAAPPMAFSQVTSAQLAEIAPETCSAFNAQQTANLPTSAAPGVTAACLSAFSATSNSLGGCTGLVNSFVGQMSPSAFEGWQSACIRVAASNVFSESNSTQLSFIDAPAFQAFDTLKVESIPIQAWSGVEQFQLGYLTANGFTGLLPESLMVIVNKLKILAVNGFTVEQTQLYPLNYAAKFKSFIPTEVAYTTEWATVAASLSTATWLKIALLEKGDQAAQGPVFDETTLKMLPFSAYEGLRADHVPLIAAADVKVLNASQTMFFTNDTVSAISADQIREISPEAFGAIDPASINGLQDTVIPAITGQQIAYLSLPAINMFTCEQLKSFTAEQLGVFVEEQRNAYNAAYEAQCKVVAPPITVVPLAAPVSQSPVSATPESSSPVHDSPNPTAPVHESPNANAPSAGTEGPSARKDELTGAEIFFIIAGIAVAVIVVGALVFFFVRKRRNNPMRQPLLRTEN